MTADFALINTTADEIRRRHLQEALDAFDAEFGPMSDDEAARLIDAARARSIITCPDRAATIDADQRGTSAGGVLPPS